MPKAEELQEQLQAMTVRGDVIQFSMLTVGESDSHVPVSFTAKRVGKSKTRTSCADGDHFGTSCGIPLRATLRRFMGLGIIGPSRE